MMIDLIEAINQCLNDQQPAVIATVVAHAGSTPRTSGTQMLIMSDGHIAGTIGGGKVEADVIRAASELLNSGQARMLSFDLNRSGLADDLDIICGGSMSVLIESVDSTRENETFYRTLARHYRTGVPCRSVTALFTDKDRLRVEGRCLVQHDNTLGGAIPLKEDAIRRLASKIPDRGGTLLLSEGANHFLLQFHHGSDGSVCIYGAGHVALELAVMTKMVNFRTIVLDDRKEFANRRRFVDADEVVVLKSFEDAFEGRVIDGHCYIVIVTRGHSHDKAVLAQALKTDAGYIGMIGSRRKRDILYRKLLAEEFSQADIDRVHCPIGLEIGAETPEEIAVSILAELIQHRALNRHARIQKESVDDV